LVGTLSLFRQGEVSCINQNHAYSPDVRAAIGASAPDLAAAWFGEGKLNPFVIEVGKAPGCQWFGNTLPSQTDAQLNRIGWTDEDNSVTVAHEFAHILLGAGHVGSNGEGNLMAAGAAKLDTKLTANHARQRARPPSDTDRASTTMPSRSARPRFNFSRSTRTRGG
jgi:hypothetical protein